MSGDLHPADVHEHRRLSTPGRRAPSALEILEELLPRLDGVVRALSIEAERSSHLQSLLRGQTNELLFVGSVQLASQAGGYYWSQDFAAPFAAVTVADTTGIGPFLVSTSTTLDAASSTALGAGTFKLPANVAMTVPAPGRGLSISGESAGSLLVVVYSKPQPFFAADLT